MTPEESTRTEALELLTRFQRRILPGMLRRVAAWKGIPNPMLREWQEDVIQELAVDCLENARAVAELPDRERHARWMRRAEAVIYRLRQSRNKLTEIAEETAAPSRQAAPQPDVHLPELVTLNNGRTNVLASIRQSGQTRRGLRQQLDKLAAQLGWDDERLSFWRARVVEALTGLAADLLLAQGPLLPLTCLGPPALEKRRARLRQLSRRFPVQPSTRAIRAALRPWIRRNQDPEQPPRALLEQAVKLGPDSGPSWLWLFEACCQEDDADGAARAVWHASRCSQVAPAAIVLARARVFEMRGRLPSAIKLLQRARRQRPLDRVLGQAITAIQALTDAPLRCAEPAPYPARQSGAGPSGASQGAPESARTRAAAPPARAPLDHPRAP